MSRTFICSTGTSAAKLLVDDAGKRLVPGKLREWVDAQGAENLRDPSNNPPRRVGEQCAPSLRGGFASTPQRDVTQAAAKILATFQDFEPIGHNLTSKLSAEIHSLARMQLEINDRVLLFASDTAEGLACAQAVEGYLMRYWEGLQVVTETVPGLQVDDAEQFRRVGVVEFTRRCLKEIANYQIVGGRELSNIVLNPTGGFKALVPYTVLIGMLKNVPFLSRQAWDDCWDNLQQLDDCEPFRFLTRMSSPQMLDKHEHINAGNGLRWLKPGRTTDRYLVSVEGWRLLVWRAIREDQVGGDYPQQIVIDPQRVRAKYAPFTRLEFSQ